MTQSGKLIALYGINNLGKSTQAKRLVARLGSEGLPADYLKYPLYDLAPSGPMLNEYLRGGNPHNLSPREFQLLQILNRTQYDRELRSRLEGGEWVVAEDYIGTGIAWGVGAGIDKRLLIDLNSQLVPVDLALLFTGERFMTGKEIGHRHEEDNTLTRLVAKVHDLLGREQGWIRIDANRSEDEVAQTIWDLVSLHLLSGAQ